MSRDSHFSEFNDSGHTTRLERRFLGWRCPFLGVVARELLQEYQARNTSQDRVDLRDIALVLPGRRALRRLTTHLVLEAERRKIVLFPPKMLTVGALPELLLSPPADSEKAPPLARMVSWIAALQQLPPDLQKALLPFPPASQSVIDWVSTAQELDQLHLDLAAAGLSMSDAALRLGRMVSIDERRWQALSQAQREYHSTLKKAGLFDLDLNLLRLFSADPEQADNTYSEDLNFAASGPSTICLISTIDLPLQLKKLLSLSRKSIVTMIHAPEEHRDGFDDFGCLNSEYWGEFALNIREEELHFVYRSEDQISLIAEIITRTKGAGFSSEEITVGVSESPLIPLLESELSEKNLRVHTAEGVPVVGTSPFELLRRLFAFVRSRSVRDLGTLLRHPDFAAWFVSQYPEDNRFRLDGSEFASLLDNYQSQHLQHIVYDEMPGTPSEKNLITSLVAVLDQLLQRVTLCASWRDFAEMISSFLLEVYVLFTNRREKVSQKQIVDACAAIRDELDQLAMLAQLGSLTFSATEAFSLLEEGLKTRDVPKPPNGDAIEVLGWLELLLDDGAVVIVSGLNEEYLPGNVDINPFLPDSMREHLGLPDNAHRYARDLYILAALRESRDLCCLISAQRALTGEPLTLSRLALAGEERSVASRLDLFYSRRAYSAVVESESDDGVNFLMPPPPNTKGVVITNLSVTAFRSYLRCPYRFYLQYVLKLRSESDQLYEMEPNLFGNLLHEVLNRFGRTKEACLTEPERIAGVLDKLLNQVVAEQFGCLCLPAVRLQIEQARERLNLFARWQADWVKEGWVIEQTERSFGRDNLFFENERGDNIGVSGRIDRIDRNRATGELAVFDYKSGDKPLPPDKVHRKKGEWVDLQLPLYYLMLEKEQPGINPCLGYINLSADVNATSLQWAKWSIEELQEAETVAKQVVNDVSMCRFWPPRDLGLGYDDFAVICGRQSFGQEEELEE